MASEPEGGRVVDVGEGDIAAVFAAELAIDVDLRRLLGEAFGDTDEVVPFAVIDAIAGGDGIGEFGTEGDLEAGEAFADVEEPALWDGVAFIDDVPHDLFGAGPDPDFGGEVFFAGIEARGGGGDLEEVLFAGEAERVTDDAGHVGGLGEEGFVEGKPSGHILRRRGAWLAEENGANKQ